MDYDGPRRSHPERTPLSPRDVNRPLRCRRRTTGVAWNAPLHLPTVALEFKIPNRPPTQISIPPPPPSPSPATTSPPAAASHGFSEDREEDPHEEDPQAQPRRPLPWPLQQALPAQGHHLRPHPRRRLHRPLHPQLPPPPHQGLHPAGLPQRLRQRRRRRQRSPEEAPEEAGLRPPERRHLSAGGGRGRRPRSTSSSPAPDPPAPPLAGLPRQEDPLLGPRRDAGPLPDQPAGEVRLRGAPHRRRPDPHLLRDEAPRRGAAAGGGSEALRGRPLHRRSEGVRLARA